MCGKRRRHEETFDERIETTERPYEGETVRLQTSVPLQAQGMQRRHAFHHGFPWWTLWLIWPLFGVIKGVVTAFGATASSVLAALPTYTVSFSALIPIALIVVGVLLLLRRR